MKAYVHTKTVQSFIHNAPNSEIAPVSISRRMDKLKEVHLYNGMLFSTKKKKKTTVNAKISMNLKIIILLKTSMRQKTTNHISSHFINCKII